MGPEAALLPVFPEHVPYEEASRALEAAGLGDGLPLVPPTGARLEAMLAGVPDPEASLGEMPPLMGRVTPAAIAYQAVLAGCRPPELPIVIAAARAVLAPELNLLGIATTTGTAAVALVVHGPAVQTLGLNASTNCLGPGHRANACIGRALALVLRNIGGMVPGVGDMATMGQPGKYGLCFGEAPRPGFPPYHVRRAGLGEEESAVTVLGVSGTGEVLPLGAGAEPGQILAPAAAAMGGSLVATGALPRGRAPGQVLLLPPELAQVLDRAGESAGSAERALTHMAAEAAGALGGTLEVPETSPLPPVPVHVLTTGGPGVKMTHMPLWGGGTVPVTVPLPSPEAHGR